MENTEIKVSVIVPVYNAVDYFAPAMDSIIDQTLREIEIICVDDGSTDRSLDLIKEYQKRDARIRIITENNAGPAAARNKGLARARGEFIVFLDADDFYELTLLEKLYEMSVKNDLDIAVCDYDIFNIKKSAFTKPVNTEYGDIFKRSAVASKNEYPDYILQATTGYVWNKMFKRSFIQEKGLAFLPELYVFEDVYFVVTALSMAERVGKVSETLVHHRVYSAQSRTRMFRKHYNQVPLVYTKIKEFLMHNGMYAPLSRSFLNLSASRCFSIYNLLWRDAKENFWSILHNDYAEALGWHLRSEADFERRDVCEFVMNIVLYDHTTYLKRLVRGIKIKVARFAKSVKFLKFKKTVSDFFRRIFVHKKKR